MSALRTGEIRDDEVPAIVALWQACGLTRPWNDPETDITFARRGPNSAVLVLRDGDTLVGSVMVGHDGHRGAVYYLSVEPSRQGQDLGRRLMDAAEAWLKARDVWKLNLMVRPENDRVCGFYDTLGYEREERIVFSRRLGAD